MMHTPAPRVTAILQALFVTFLWSTSWVLIKIGLEDIPALTFAGLRYMLAFLCLLPILARPVYIRSFHSLTGRDWVRLVFLGLILYTFTQGAMFLSLAYLPAVTVSLLLNLTTIVVAFLGILLLSERPTFFQLGGVCLNAVGLIVYFFPIGVPQAEWLGLLVAIIAVLTNAGASVLGRGINRDGNKHPLVVTGVSMGAGAIALLLVGVTAQGLPSLSLSHWAIIAWLAVVNTAFAFTVWNLSLRHLSAIESSIINSTMLIQIAILAWLFLGEEISLQKGVGLALAGAGVIIVQLRPSLSTINPVQKLPKTAKIVDQS